MCDTLPMERSFAQPSSSTSFELAKHESYGFFDSIPDHIWLQMKQYAKNFPQYHRVKAENYQGEDKLARMAQWFQQNVESVFNCLNKQRIGGSGLGDGPKFVCDPMTVAKKPGCLIYSIGSNGKYEFEDFWAELSDGKCEVHTFDFGNYERKGDKSKKNIHYHRLGLGTPEEASKPFYDPKSQQNVTIKSFDQIIKDLGHQNREIDLLKIDCEGCEYKTFQDLTTKNIGQINIEVHLVKGQLTHDMFDAFRANNYAMYSKEFNVMTPKGKGSLVEFSFIRLHPDFWK